MILYENKLIQAVDLKDKKTALNYLSMIVQTISKKKEGLESFKHYLLMLNGVFYWNLVKDSDSIAAIKPFQKERNSFSLQINRTDSPKQLQEVFRNMILYYTRIEDEIILQCENPTIRQVLIYLFNNCHKRVNLDVLTMEFHISKSYLSHLLSQETNHTLPQILNRFRIHKAVKLMEQTNYTMKEICYLSGFRSPSYFGEQFKRKMHMTPGQYQQSLKRKPYHEKR